MQFTKTTKLDTKTYTDVYKVKGTKMWVGPKWLTKREKESHKQGYRVGTNTEKSRFKHIESGHKQHKQGHKQSFSRMLTMVFIDIIFVRRIHCPIGSIETKFILFYLSTKHMWCYLSTVLSIRDYSLDFGLHTLSARLSYCCVFRSCVWLLKISAFQ